MKVGSLNRKKETGRKQNNEAKLACTEKEGTKNNGSCEERRNEVEIMVDGKGLGRMRKLGTIKQANQSMKTYLGH